MRRENRKLNLNKSAVALLNVSMMTDLKGGGNAVNMNTISDCANSNAFNCQNRIIIKNNNLGVKGFPGIIR